MLCRIVLDPRRIWRTAHISGYLDAVVDDVVAQRLAESTVADLRRRLPDAPAIRDLESDAVQELAVVFRRRAGEPLPSALPSVAAMFGWALHLESVPSELPKLADALRADVAEGGSRRSRGQVFLAEHEELLRQLSSAS